MTHTIQQIIGQHKTAIAGVLTQERIKCQWEKPVQGNLVMSYRLRPMTVSQGTVTRLQRLSHALAMAMNAESCRVQQNCGIFEIQIPSPVTVPVKQADLLEHTSRLSAAIGLDLHGDPATIDLNQHGAIGWIGPSRRGKTQSMKSAAGNLLHQNPNTLIAVACLESKLPDWAVFDSSRQSLGVASTPDDWKRLFDWLARYTEKPKSKQYHILALIDDLPALLERADLKSALKTIASAGAGVGVHLLIGTQGTGSKEGSGGMFVENNLTAKVLYKPSSNTTGARNAGSAGSQLEQLSSIKGDALLMVDGYATRVATSIADDRMIAQIRPGRSEKIYRCWGVQGDYSHQSQAVTEPVTGGYSNRLQAVIEPVTGVGSGINEDNRLAVTEVSGKLPSNRELTSQELGYVRQKHAELGSINAVCREVFGGKNDKIIALVKQAIATTEPTDPKIIKFPLQRAG